MVPTDDVPMTETGSASRRAALSLLSRYRSTCCKTTSPIQLLLAGARGTAAVLLYQFFSARAKCHCGVMCFQAFATPSSEGFSEHLATARRAGCGMDAKFAGNGTPGRASRTAAVD